MPDPDAKRPIRILTVDDHPMLRDGIAALVSLEPDMTIVGEAADGAEALEAFRRLKPDVTLMDLHMPVMGGIDALSAIRREHAGARVIMLTMSAADVLAARALKAGAVGYLLKSSLRNELLDAIRVAHACRRSVPAGIAEEVALHIADEQLSLREVSTLQLAAAGLSNKQIAWRLAIAEDTVKSHMKSIFAKLHANDRTHAVTIALRRGIIEA